MREVHDGMNGSCKIVFECLCEVDIQCDSIIAPRWKSTLDLKLVLSVLGVTQSHILKNLEVTMDIEERL